MIPGSGQALSPSFEANGDIFIGEDFENDTWLIGGTANINGDLTIRAGGTVMVTDGVINFRSTTDGLNKLIIEDGGQLILINSILKTEKALYDINDALGVLVRNDGTINAENSQLTFNGKILVDNANFVAAGTQISGPLFTAMSSQVELYDSELIDIPGIPMLQEETYPYSFAASSNHTLDVNYLFERNPDSVSSGQNVVDLEMNDSRNVTLAQTQVVTVTGFDIGGLIFDEGEAVLMELKAEYKTADDFDDGGTPNVFQYAEYLSGFVSAPNMRVEATYEPHAPAATNQEMVISQDLTSLDLSSADLSKLSVRLTNTKAQNVYIDRIWVEVKLGIPAYHNITVAGTSEFTAVNSMLGVNYQNYSVPSYSKLVAAGASQVNLYGVTVSQDGYGTYDEFNVNGTGPFITTERQITFKPLSQGIDDTSGELNIFDLFADDASYYVVPGGEVLNTQSINTGGITGKISSAELIIEYSPQVGYTSSQYVQWSVNGAPLTNTDILVDTPGLIE